MLYNLTVYWRLHSLLGRYYAAKPSNFVSLRSSDWTWKTTPTAWSDFLRNRDLGHFCIITFSRAGGAK